MYSAPVTRAPGARLAIDAASAAASAPYSAFGSVWVSRVEARTRSSRRCASWPKQTPRSGLRIAGPLPAENTPLRVGAQPSQSFTTARRVANPTPAGRSASQTRSWRARLRVNASTSPAEAIRAWATMHACSVSSDTMPRWKTRLGPVISGNRRRCRRFERPSQASPTLSPTAVPSRQPRMASRLGSAAIRSGGVRLLRGL